MRVPITGLVGHPGETRAVATAVERDAFGTDPWGPAEQALLDPIGLDLHLDAVVDGILVRGELSFTLELGCARCLRPQRQHRTVEVVELFQRPRAPDETLGPDGEELEAEPGYVLIDDATAIDLSTMVRDAVLVDLPVRVLCREDCQGLCPTCGADRNETDCGHDAGPDPDPRWGKLAELRLPEDRP